MKHRRHSNFFLVTAFVSLMQAESSALLDR